MRIGPIVAAYAIVFGQLVSADAAGQSSAEIKAINQELDSLQAVQANMQQELLEIKAMLQKASAAVPAAGPLAGAEITLAGAPIRGAPDAKVVLVEYSDFQCPFCASYAANSYPQIIREYVDIGKLRYAFMSLPLEGLHPQAFREHLAAACAADEGRFWDMHDRLFANPKATDAEALERHAAALSLRPDKFRNCIESESHAAEIRRAIAAGNTLGVTGTPTFLIGIAGADGKLKVAKVISGAKPYSAFKGAIDSVLATTLARGDDAAPSASTASGWTATRFAK